jgi:hypothetical protein
MGSLETHMASLWPHFGLTAMIPAASAPKRSEARPGNLISVLAWEVCGLTWHLPGLFWEFLALIWELAKLTWGSLGKSLGSHEISLLSFGSSLGSLGKPEASLQAQGHNPRSLRTNKSGCLEALWSHLGSLLAHFCLRATIPAACTQERVELWELSGLTSEISGPTATHFELTATIPAACAQVIEGV